MVMHFSRSLHLLNDTHKTLDNTYISSNRTAIRYHIGENVKMQRNAITIAFGRIENDETGVSVIETNCVRVICIETLLLFIVIEIAFIS